MQIAPQLLRLAPSKQWLQLSQVIIFCQTCCCCKHLVAITIAQPAKQLHCCIAKIKHSASHCLVQVVDALHHAGKDERVKGIVAYVGDSEGPPSQLAQVQELRDAVLHFR